MFLDIVSVIVSAYGAVQSVRGKKTLEEKKAVCKNLFFEVDTIYQLLSEAKRYHHGFESLIKAELTDLHSYVREKNSQSSKRLRSHVKTLITQVSHFIDLNPDNLPDIPFEASKMGQLQGEDKVNIRHLSKVYPQLRIEFKSFNDEFNSLQGYLANDDFGKEFRTCVSRLHHSAMEVLSKSDKTILYSTPLLASIFRSIQHAIQAF